MCSIGRARLGVSRQTGRALTLHPQVVVQAAGVHVAAGNDEHAVAGDRPFVQGCAASPLAPPLSRWRVLARVGIAGVVGIREGAVLAAALEHVEHRVDAAVLHVHPYRLGRLDRLRERRRHRHEVEVVGDPNLVGLRQLVVQHVVQQPLVFARVELVAVARVREHARLLFTGREEAFRQARNGRVVPREVQPHAMVEVDHVDGGHGAVGKAKVRRHAEDVAVFFGLRDRARVADVVLSGHDVDRHLELQPLGAVGNGIGDDLRRRSDDRHRGVIALRGALNRCLAATSAARGHRQRTGCQQAQ